MQVETETTSRPRPTGLRRRRRVSTPERASTVTIPSPVLIELRKSQRRTGVAFEVLLGVAACLSLVAVVQRAIESDSSDPTVGPPAVFVQTD